MTVVLTELDCNPIPTLLVQVEELDYDNERDNLLKFSALYGPGGPAARSLRRRGGGEVVTPVAVPALCSRRVLTMSWIEGAPRPNPKALNLAPTPTPTLALSLSFSLTSTFTLTRRAAIKARLRSSPPLRAAPRRVRATVHAVAAAGHGRHARGPARGQPIQATAARAALQRGPAAARAAAAAATAAATSGGAAAGVP